MANSDSPKGKKRKCNERQQLFGPYYLLLFILSGKDTKSSISTEHIDSLYHA